MPLEAKSKKNPTEWKSSGFCATLATRVRNFLMRNFSFSFLMRNFLLRNFFDAKLSKCDTFECTTKTYTRLEILHSRCDESSVDKACLNMCWLPCAGTIKCQTLPCSAVQVPCAVRSQPPSCCTSRTSSYGRNLNCIMRERGYTMVF